ncbi:MAG: iron-sulfur cluster assembly accessory protein [Microcoleaceae cyanobacterium]
MIKISPIAAQEILRLRVQQSHDNAFFRLGVSLGGCCQWFYTMNFEEKLQSDDTVYPVDRLQVVIDSESLTYLEGLQIDYSEDLMGGGFRFKNPQATQSCGCGHSFSTTSQSAEEMA